MHSRFIRWRSRRRLAVAVLLLVSLADSPTHAADPAPPETGKGPILYYRNPMGQPDTSPVPKEDSMGMAYIPVYADAAADDTGSIRLSPSRIQTLGVRSEPVVRRSLDRTLRVAGTVRLDERHLAIVSARVDGWIEKLMVNAQGDAIAIGQPLMEIYSPEIAAAQQEYLLSLAAIGSAAQGERAGASRLADVTLRRLQVLDMPDDEIERLRRDRVVTRRMTLRAKSAGNVIEKPAVEGMFFSAGDVLYKTAQLDRIWVIAQVFEQDLALVELGARATVATRAWPGETFTGTVEFVYPMLAADTRTAQVRIAVENADDRLKDGMFGDVQITAGLGGEIVAVPESSVLDSGTRQAVLIDKGEGAFEPRPVTLGRHADGYYEVLEGVVPDERVVVGANFLIDAESNLRAALRAFVPPAAPPAAPPPPPAPAPTAASQSPAKGAGS